MNFTLTAAHKTVACALSTDGFLTKPNQSYIAQNTEMFQSGFISLLQGSRRTVRCPDKFLLKISDISENSTRLALFVVFTYNSI